MKKIAKWWIKQNGLFGMLWKFLFRFPAFIIFYLFFWIGLFFFGNNFVKNVLHEEEV